MLQPLLFQARYMAQLAARRAVWGSIGGVFLLISLIFFTVAIWILLESAFGALVAAFVLGFLTAGIGFGAMAFSRLPPRVVPPAQSPIVGNPARTPEVSLASLISALIMGIGAGKAVRRRR